MKWPERWIARAQRKADLRAERFLRHEEGVRAGTEPPSLLDRMESWNTLFLERFETCVRRMPAGPARRFCSFATETSARWYAVELARQVRQAGITALRPADIFPERPRSARSERVLAAEIIGVSRGSGHGLLWLPRHARAHWRQVRTGRR